MADYPQQDGNRPIKPHRYEVFDAEGRSLDPPPRRSPGPKPWVSYGILALCVLTYILALVTWQSPRPLTFSPGLGLVFPGIITHMFAHADLLHLLFNMIVLFFFGTVMERTYGHWRYVLLYFVAGIFAALAQAAVMPNGLLLGASGALAGVMAAFVRHYPHVRVYIWGILPMPAWLMILIWIGYNIIGAGSGEASVAFVAHLAGFAAGGALSIMLMPPGRPGLKRPVWPDQD